MRLVEGHAEEPHLGELRPHLVGKSLRRSDDGLARLETVILADVFLDAVAQQLLFFAENEIHDQSPRTICEMMLRWISFEPP